MIQTEGRVGSLPSKYYVHKKRPSS